MNNPFDYIPDDACGDSFRQLLDRIGKLRRSRRESDVNFCRELDEGKMLGVLIAEDSMGERHTLYAFSGQIGGMGFHFPGFVGPVFDYLRPDGYFKIHEAEISRMNREIELFEERVTSLKRDYEDRRRRHEVTLDDFKEHSRRAREERAARRERGAIDAQEMAAMIRRSQFEKAEFRRLKKRVEADLAPYSDKLCEALAILEAMKERRRRDSEALQRWLFSNFRVLNAHGESRSLEEIFAATPMNTPPSGAGECCAPKLLQAAYAKGWRPISMAEYWYGKSKRGEIRHHGYHYPACRGKCLPVLGWMLQGLEINPPLENDCSGIVTRDPEILYENRWFCVVDKPSGMLSVPGKGNSISVQDWLEGRFGHGGFVKMVHRLDQDTSGLLMAAFDPDTFKLMQSLFARRMVSKTYVAELEGDWREHGYARSGRIALPLAADILDRPRQRVDFVHGKESVTDYEFTAVVDGRSRVVFHPLTGRTHQLRVHAASGQGLGMSIAGDRLYGRYGDAGRERLYLHACGIEFTFPTDGRHYLFESRPPF